MANSNPNNLNIVFKQDGDRSRRDLLSEAKNRLANFRNGNSSNNISVNSPGPPIIIREALADYIDKLEQEEKLDHLLQKSNRVIFKCKTVFPFDLFPDRLIVDETKINVILKEFFATESVHSVLIQNIKDIQIQSSVLFASLIIVPDVYTSDPVTIQYLHKKDAYEVRRLVQGIIVCQREGVDLAKLDIEQLKDKVRQVGTATTTPP